MGLQTFAHAHVLDELILVWARSIFLAKHSGERIVLRELEKLARRRKTVNATVSDVDPDKSSLRVDQSGRKCRPCAPSISRVYRLVGSKCGGLNTVCHRQPRCP